MAAKEKSEGKVRYAVVGLGYFAQAAVLPAFAHAKNSKLAALISDDPEKLETLGRKYHVENRFAYDDYPQCLSGKDIDAVYIVLPNDMHKDFTIRAAKMGVHVLCEKPMAVTERDCEEMIREAGEHDVRLMIAYRLHLDAAHLKALDLVRTGKIGEPRFFNSVFSMQVQDENIRLKADRGGGTLYDIGIYCINAARTLFEAEPYQVFATSCKSDDPRFREVEEMTSAILRFPGERHACFTASFGAADTSEFRIVGTEGDLRMEPAYDFTVPLKYALNAAGKKQEKEFDKRDQVAAELVHFSDCILSGKEPEPSGREGWADVRVIRALYESARTGKPVGLDPIAKKRTLEPDMEIHKPASGKPDMFHAESPTRE